MTSSVLFLNFLFPNSLIKYYPVFKCLNNLLLLLQTLVINLKRALVFSAFYYIHNMNKAFEQYILRYIFTWHLHGGVATLNSHCMPPKHHWHAKKQPKCIKCFFSYCCANIPLDPYSLFRLLWCFLMEVIKIGLTLSWM